MVTSSRHTLAPKSRRRQLNIAAQVSVLIFSFLLCACASQGNLYQRLGGEQGVTTVVDNMLFNLAEKPSLVQHFQGVDIDRFRNGLITQLCDISDGPCQYRGESMAVVHGGMQITAAEFDTLVTCLLDAMDEAQIGFRTQSELVRRLAVFRDDIVEGKR